MNSIKICPRCKQPNPQLIRRDRHGEIFGCEKCTTTEIVKEDSNAD